MIQEFQIIKLYFHEPVALMSEKKDEFQNEVNVLPSDMLKAALISALALEKNQTEIDQLNHNLVISSAYLFAEEHYFFPKPMSILPIETTFDPKHQKLIKNIQFIEKNIFEKVISGQKQKIMDNNLTENGKLWVNDNQNFLQPIYKSQTEERVSIGNTNVFEQAEKGSPYYISRTYFNRDIKAGMYFIYQTENEKLLLKALDRLQYEGIGADRRLGNGKFYFEKNIIQINIPDDANYNLMLSKFIPSLNNIKAGILNNASYKFSLRGGFVAGTINEKYSNWTKQNIKMFDEGSLFESKIKPEGKNVKLSNAEMEKVIQHSVYRDGRPVILPIKIEVKN